MPFMFDEKGPKRTGPAYQAMLEAERNALVDEVVRCGSEPPGELE
jgi:hypothetical protein